MIDVQQLRAPVELSRLDIVSAAVESLGFGQSTVSHQLVVLSRAAGAVLLTRVGRGVRFTEEGRALTVRGQGVLDLLKRTEREVASTTRAEAGRAHLATFPSVVVFLVPGVLDVADRQCPGPEVEFVDAEPPEALEALWRRQADATLSFSYVDDDTGKGLQAEHLLDDVLYFITHPGGIMRIADGARRRWVTGCACCRKELLIVGQANGFASETAYAPDDCVAVQVLAAAGVGAALSSGMALSTYRHEGVQVRLLAREQRRVEVVTRAERPRLLAIDVLVEACQAAARHTSLHQPAVTTGGSTASQ